MEFLRDVLAVVSPPSEAPDRLVIDFASEFMFLSGQAHFHVPPLEIESMFAAKHFALNRQPVGIETVPRRCFDSHSIPHPFVSPQSHADGVQ